LQDGQEIYPYFDSLLAKVIAYGKDRSLALKKLDRALAEMTIEGVATTIPFFKLLLEKEEFIQGNFCTNFIEKSGIAQELMLKPYLQKKIACNHKEIDEKMVADLVYKIYRAVKTTSNEAAENPMPISKWILADRVGLNE